MKITDIRNKDYVSIDNTLFLAVISDDHEQDMVKCWLRYLRTENGMKKLTTQEASRFMTLNYPEFLFHSTYADNELHGVPLNKIDKVYSARTFPQILKTNINLDNKQADALDIINLFIQQNVEKNNIGITGSLLINAQSEQSDIDLLIYGREHFFKTRDIIRQLMKNGLVHPLDKDDWRKAYQRRDCSLDFESYLFHEKRKFNKFKYHKTKVDISMIPDRKQQVNDRHSYKKSGLMTIKAIISGDQYAFDNPARYYLDHEQIQEVVVYTATYVGQAKKNEKIEASGVVEVAGEKRRLVVGTSREATAEYIKLIK
ncbi:MAG: nucleotidyltransferase domain-containing protein [Pseudomonadota bacterium]